MPPLGNPPNRQASVLTFDTFIPFREQVGGVGPTVPVQFVGDPFQAHRGCPAQTRRQNHPDELRHTVLNAADQTAINLVAEQAGDATQLLSVARVLLSEEEHGLRRRRLDYELARLKRQEARTSIEANRSNLLQNTASVAANSSKQTHDSAYFRVFQAK